MLTSLGTDASPHIQVQFIIGSKRARIVLLTDILIIQGFRQSLCHDMVKLH